MNRSQLRGAGAGVCAGTRLSVFSLMNRSQLPLPRREPQRAVDPFSILPDESFSASRGIFCAVWRPLAFSTLPDESFSASSYSDVQYRVWHDFQYSP